MEGLWKMVTNEGYRDSHLLPSTFIKSKWPLLGQCGDSLLKILACDQRPEITVVGICNYLYPNLVLIILYYNEIHYTEQHFTALQYTALQ